MRRMLAAATLATVTAVGGCTSDTTDEAGKYTQTWDKSYSATSCAEWAQDMTSNEQWVAAADMLTSARNNGDGGDGLPPDSMVDQFQSGISTACVVPTMTLAEVGAGLYLTERATFQP